MENPDPNFDADPIDAQDTDADGIPDYIDTDDDNDGIPTLHELGDQDGITKISTMMASPTIWIPMMTMMAYPPSSKLTQMPTNWKTS